MATDKQILGGWGEKTVIKHCSCPSCKQGRTTKQLPPNFKCADLVCDFCGYLSQVKTSSVKNIDILPSKILGAAWGPQKARMDSGIYFPLYVVLKSKTGKEFSINFLSADLQTPEMFVPRKPLSPNAKRSGWQGFYIDVDRVKNRFVSLL